MIHDTALPGMLLLTMRVVILTCVCVHSCISSITNTLTLACRDPQQHGKGKGMGHSQRWEGTLLRIV